MGNAGALLGAGGIDPFQHLRIDGGLIVCEKEFQIARRGSGFRFREPVDQFVKLWFAHNKQCSERPPQMADSQWGCDLKEDDLPKCRLIERIRA